MKKINFNAAAGVALLIIFVIVALVWIGVELADERILSEIRLPILAIIGVVSMLVALTLATVALAIMDLSDKTQALGMPEGSVRAVIALALIVLFSIIAVFLYSDLSSGGEIRQLGNLDRVQLTRLQQEAAREGSRVIIYEILPDPALAEGPFRVTYQMRAGDDASELAKQLITLMGTLVTSVAAFYFGSRAVSTAQAAVAGGLSGFAQPTIYKVRPEEIPANTKDVLLTALGTGLDRIKEVKLVKGPTMEIPGKIVDMNAGALVFRVTQLPGDATQSGDWEVVVTSAGEGTARSPIKAL